MSRRGQVVASFAAWALALSIAGSSLYGTTFIHPAPFADQWDLTDRLTALRGGDIVGFLRDAWQPHNEHRLVLFNIVNAVDYFAFDYRNRFNAVALVAAMAAGVGLFLGILRQAGVDRGLTARWLCPTAIALIFNGVQSETLTWALGLQWHLADASFLAALYAATRLAARAPKAVGGGSGALVACVVCSVLASLSSANGLLVWPVILLFALWSRLSKAMVGLYAVAGAAMLILYLSRAEGLALLPALRSSPVEVLAYTARFAGNLWYWADVPFQGEWAAIAIGYALLIAATALTLAISIRGAWVSPAGRALLAIVLFGLGTGVLSALGRVSEFSPDQAFAPRYASVGGLLWAAVLGLAIETSERGPALLQMGRWGRASVVIWSLGALAAYQPKALETIRTWAQERERAALALLVGVRDDELLSRLHPRPERLASAAAELRAHNKSIFAEKRARYVGESLPDLKSGEPCPGAILRTETVSRIADGAVVDLRLYGWALTPGKGGPILVASDDGKIVGLGSLETNVDWFAVVQPAAGQLTAWAMTGGWENSSLCRVGD